MKHLYYYVPPCPKCKSNRTGRFVNLLLSSEETVRKSALQHGEYIRARKSGRVENAYCEDCGHMWIDNIVPRFMDAVKIRYEKELRQTEEALNRLESDESNETIMQKIWG